MTTSNFIVPAAAAELLNEANVSFVDGSWYLPSMNRNGREEYETMRIPGAVYFDIDKIARQDTDLPHMLPDPETFAREVSTLGISNENLIIVYDGPGLFSSARVWWTFRVMGAEDVRILQGGFDAWKTLGLPVETGNPNPPIAAYFQPTFDGDAVVNQEEVVRFLSSSKGVVLDARPTDRFNGLAEEPRKGLRSGHMPGAESLPSSHLVENGKLISVDRLEEKFSEMGLGKADPVITSCGSGVTAAILTLALAETGRDNSKLYDGSWAEWGRPEGPDIAKDG